MNSSPLVSICIQTYNQKDYIQECLDGILMQKTNFSYEIILGEDESNDGTREICIEYAAKFPDIIKLHLRSRKDVIYINDRPTGRFNFVENLKIAKGKYIALCEGDDYWTDLLKLQKQVDFLEANLDYSICFHKVSVFNQKLLKLENDTITRSVDTTTTVLDLAQGNYIHTPSVVLRNDFDIPNWFYKSPIGDWSLYMVSLKNRKIKKLSDNMAVYRVHDSSLWSVKSEIEKFDSTKKSIELVKNNIEYLTNDVHYILKSRIAKYSRTKKITLKNILSYFKQKS